jgi:hypothetical protein
MPVFASEGQFDRFSSLVKYIEDKEKPNTHNELVTVNEAAAKTYALGTVLGKVTATGKFKIAVQSAVDGSQVPVAIVIGEGSLGYPAPTFNVPATTDTKVLTLARGKAIVAKEGLKLDASFSDAAKVQSAYDALKAVGILAESAN